MKEELLAIQDLMTDLISKMEYGEDDFSERLGRPKPEVASVEIDVAPEGMEEGMEDEMGMEMDEGPEAKLKSRLMKMRS